MKNAQILVVDDESDIRALLDEILSEEGYSVTTAADARAARAAHRENDFDLVLLDIWMPDIDGISLLKEWSEAGETGPVVMMSGHGTVDTAVEATRLGAVDFIEKPVSLAKLLRTVGKALTPRRGKTRAGIMSLTHAPMGKSEPMRLLREQISRVAEHDSHTLICGEAGTGREQAARFLASRSERAGQPLVLAMGGDLTTEDCEHLLLGTPGVGGLFERARGGILLINDMPDVSAEAQRLLLSALKRGKSTNSYEDDAEDFDVRVLACAPAAFDRDDACHPELLSILATAIIRIPPLREYSADVPELLRQHVELLVDTEQLTFRRFTVAAQNRLRNYPWPGNLRELRSFVKRILIMGGDEEVSLQEVETQLQTTASANEPLVKQDLLSMPLREAREHFERAYLQQQLIICGGKVGQLAKRVGMERTHLYRKLRSLGVDFRQVSGED